MSRMHATILSRQLSGRDTVHGNSELNRGLIFAAALFLAVAIVELWIIVRAAPSIAEIGSLYVTAT